jgi:hypothetical protein
VGPRRRRHAGALPEPCLIHHRGLAILVAFLLAACAAPPAVPTSSGPGPAIASPDVTSVAFARLLGARDAAWRAGDVAAALALVAPDAPPAFRERERQLAALAAQGVPLVPARGAINLTRERGTVRLIEILETDAQGRTRMVRYFGNGPLDRLRLTEPPPSELGEPVTTRGERVDTRTTTLDADSCATVLRYAEAALGPLVTRLGEAYRPSRRPTFECLPTVQPDLPPLASAYTRGSVVSMLTTASLVVASGPAAAWSRTAVTHELAHVLLFTRGNGPFVIAEGIPLWLTDDRRQPELDRLVRADALWSLPHLIDGPASDVEFYAGYAQASSFVRFLAATYGDAAVIQAWEGNAALPFDEAFALGFHVTPQSAYAAWRASLGR